MDLEHGFYMEFNDRLKSSGLEKVKITGFDEELIYKSEIHSEKWTSLFKYSLHDEHSENISHILENTELNTGQVNAFNQQNHRRDFASNQKSITEDRSLILLDKTYFEFDNSNDHIEEKTTTCSTVNDSTVFSISKSSSETKLNQITKEESRILPENNSTKSKKRQNKNRKKNQNITNARNVTVNTGSPTNLIGGPPGVKAMNSKNMRCDIDLTKNTTSSLHFRL